jgi:hypothetical protein
MACISHDRSAVVIVHVFADAIADSSGQGVGGHGGRRDWIKV